MEKLAFLFDNDGVLIDSQEFHWLAWQRLMKEEKQFFLDEKTFLETFGKRNDLILQKALPQTSKERHEAFALRKEEIFREVARGEIKLLPGIEKFLQELQQKKIPRIIASSTPRANLNMFIKETVLGKYFDAFVSADEVAHGKPFPDVFLEAAKRIGVPPKYCIVIEDAPAGITAGKKAGCFVVALETTHKKEALQESDLIYPSGNELDLTEIIEAQKKYLSAKR